MDKEAELIRLIAEGDQKTLKAVYGQHRSSFISWSIKNYNCSEFNAKEAYQYAFFIFYSKIRSGEIKYLSSSIRTYIYAVGKNHVLQEYRNNSKLTFNINDQILGSENDDVEVKLEKEAKYNSIENGLKQLGDPCRTVLLMFYYGKADLNLIASKLGYRNTDTVKTLKYKCIQRLKKLVGEVKENIHG
jgi:RNA polymerase sigma-70 factor (ECF subfamily)